jgi:hypothetical protein
VHGTEVYSVGVGPKGPALERFPNIKKNKKNKNKIKKKSKSCFYVSVCFSQCCLLFFVKAGRFDDAKAVINDLWGAAEVEKAIQEFQSVSKNDGNDLNSRWLQLLEEPHSRGCIKVVFGNKGNIC